MPTDVELAAVVPDALERYWRAVELADGVRAAWEEAGRRLTVVWSNGTESEAPLLRLLRAAKRDAERLARAIPKPKDEPGLRRKRCSVRRRRRGCDGDGDGDGFVTRSPTAGLRLMPTAIAADRCVFGTGNWIAGRAEDSACGAGGVADSGGRYGQRADGGTRPFVTRRVRARSPVRSCLPRRRRRPRAEHWSSPSPQGRGLRGFSTRRVPA